MQFFNKVGSSRKQKQKSLEAEAFGNRSLWKQKPLEAEAFGSRSLWKKKPLEAEALNFRVLTDCLNQRNLKKLKEASSVCTKEIF